MDREKLAQYRNLCLEIKELEKKIDNLKAREVSDKVLASSPEFPYNAYQLKIYGYEDYSYINKIKIRLEKRLNRCKQMRIEILDWIDSIKDSRTRLVFQLRYVEGKSWVYISRQLGSSNESYARMIHNRFLNI